MKIYDENGKLIEGNWELCKAIVTDYDKENPFEHTKIGIRVVIGSYLSVIPVNCYALFPEFSLTGFRVDTPGMKYAIAPDIRVIPVASGVNALEASGYVSY